MEERDKEIACINCGKGFLFSVRDQKYYEELGFRNEPKRCRECRALLKRERQFVTNSRGDVKEFFKCVCAACGRPAFVPFKPTGSKPVYCRDCLVAKRIREQRQGESQLQAPEAPLQEGGPVADQAAP